MSKLIILFLFLVMSAEVNAETLLTRCVSESGNSIYLLELDLTNRKGNIRYQFMEQDVFYDVNILPIVDDLIRGIAEFKESNTGETKGSSFRFTYDTNKNTFKELNIIASCE